MKRASILASVLMILMVVGVLLVPGPAWAGGHYRGRYRSCYRSSYHRTAFCSARRYVSYGGGYSYRRCVRPRYTRYYDHDGYDGYYGPRRSHLVVYVNLGDLFGGGHRRCR